MELRLLWRVLLRRWWLILLPTMVALILTIPALRAAVTPAVNYGLGIRFTASPKPDGSGTFQDQSYTPWLASEYTVNNLAQWIHTDSFAREVSNELAANGKVIAAESMRPVFTADSVRSILTFVVTAWPNADDLAAIGAAASTVLVNKSEAYFPQTDAKKLVVVALDRVLVEPRVPSITERFSPLSRVGVGLLVGLTLAFLAEYLDRSLQSRAEVESLGLMVLAEILR